MNSIKNVPARVLSRRPGHSLEAEREQFDKTQASGGGGRRAGGREGGRRLLPCPLTRVSQGPACTRIRSARPAPRPLASRPPPPEPPRAQVNRKRARGAWGRGDPGRDATGDFGGRGARTRWRGPEVAGGRDAAAGQVGSRCAPPRPGARAGAARRTRSALGGAPSPAPADGPLPPSPTPYKNKKCPHPREAMHFLEGNSLFPFLLSCFPVGRAISYYQLGEKFHVGSQTCLPERWPTRK